MPWQLIYTSAPRGLLSGQSGFCTVARSADLREALVQRLEQISSYHYLRVAEAATANRNPTISAFRLLDLRGAKYYVLTRIQPCGLDFTARTNHLAHHLVFQPDELSHLPSPAALLRHWPGWMASWQGEPRLLEEAAPAGWAAARKTFLPAQTWAKMTGDGGRAAGLLESECVRGCYLLCPPGTEEQVLEMYCETLQLLNFNGQFPLRPWRHTFTTFLQAEDNPNDFQWRGCQENTPAYKQALTRSAPMIALRAVRVPANSLVKLAREEPKPPPAPGTTPPPAPSPHAPRSALKTLPREPFARSLSAPPSTAGGANIRKPARSNRPALLDFNITINRATLTGLGIFVAVVATLLAIKLHWPKPPVEQGNPALAPVPKPAPAATPPPRKSPPVAAAAPDPTPLDGLVGDGPTYVLAVPNLANFSLPVDSIIRLQNLLHRYDHFDTLPSDIQVAVDTDHWDFPPGAPMIVGGRTNEQFSASTPGLDCQFDYADWLAKRGSSLNVRANFKSVPAAFSLHFGFSSATHGDPFRLLIVNENNPPAPLHLAGKLVQLNRQDLGASLDGSLRECLATNFLFLDQRQGQLQPWVRTDSGPARYLYKDWPAEDVPAFGCELDFANLCRRLGTQRENREKRLELLRQPLGRPLGHWLDATNWSRLDSFLAFSSDNLKPRRFLEYLDEIKKNAPNKSWIKSWPSSLEGDPTDDVSSTLENLCELWSQNRPQDNPMLTVTNAGRTTNFFFYAWQSLKERESVREQLDKAQKRLSDLDRVAYVGLFMVDRRQSRPGLEIIRFDQPPQNLLP